MLKWKNKRPKWSLKTNFWAAVGISVLISILVLFGLEKSIWLELEFIVAILSLFCFIYLFYVLFHGIRFEKNEKYSVTFEAIDFSSVLDGASNLDTQGSFTSAGGEAGCLGLIVGFLIDLIVSIILSFVIAIVLWAGINIVFSSVLILFLPAFYLFKKSLRYAVAKGRSCYKNFSKSFFYSLGATLISSSWFYMIIALGYYFSNIVNKSKLFG